MYKHILEYNILEDFDLNTYEDDPIYEFEVEESVDDIIEHFSIEANKEYPLTIDGQRYIRNTINALYLNNRLDVFNIYNTPVFREFLKDKYQVEARNEYKKSKTSTEDDEDGEDMEVIEDGRS